MYRERPASHLTEQVVEGWCPLSGRTSTAGPEQRHKDAEEAKNEAIKTRRLKKADFEVDFFFMDRAELFPSAVKPEMVVEMLGEMLDACQHFFSNF